MKLWPLFLLSLAALVAWYGEPRPLALVVAVIATITAVYDLVKGLSE